MESTGILWSLHGVYMDPWGSVRYRLVGAVELLVPIVFIVVVGGVSGRGGGGGLGRGLIGGISR